MVAAAEGPHVMTVHTVHLDMPPTGSSAGGSQSKQFSFTGGSYVMTIGFFTLNPNQIVGKPRKNAGGQYGTPDPTDNEGWESIGNQMVKLGAGTQTVACTFGPQEPDPVLDPGLWDYRVDCSIGGTPEPEWSFSPERSGTFNWQVSLAPSPARVIGNTATKNPFAEGQCTWGAEQEMYLATGKFMQMTGDKNKKNAYQWDSTLNAMKWVRSLTPQSRSVVVLSQAAMQNADGHVAWVEGVEYDDGVTYLHTIEMNAPGYPNQWVSERREYDGGTDNQVPRMDFILAP